MPAYVPPVNETTSPYAFDSVVLVGAGQVSGGPMGPSDFGLKSWNVPLWAATGTSTFSVVGSVYLAAIHLSANLTYGNIYVNVLATGGTASAGSNFAGVYNSAGTLVATTADISTILGTAAGTTGVRTFPLSTAFTPSASGTYYTGMFFNASGTASFPVLAGAAGQTAANALTAFVGSYAPLGFNANIATASAPYSWAAVATTSATQMPATFALGSAGTTGAQAYWVAMA